MKSVLCGISLLAGLALVPIAPLMAQPSATSQQQVISPEVTDDGKVTFRIKAPQANNVKIQSPDLGGYKPIEEPQKNDQGVWEITYGPINPPLVIRYLFNVDGLVVNDPINRDSSEANGRTFSLVHMPGLDFMDTKDVPHGAVSEVTYYSKVLQRFRRMHVYTPPGYENSTKNYPVFYLLHGASDSDDSWSSVGRANFILDNMIASGEAVPMIIVMPDGHVQRTRERRRGAGMQEFVNEFIQDIRPTVEERYRVLTDRSHQAIAGLSMGGAQTINIAFEDLDEFGYIGVFSSGIFELGRRNPAGTESGPGWEKQHAAALKNAELKQGLKLFWIGIGKDDFLLEISRATVDMLKKHDFEIEYQETSGGHIWRNWRDYLHEFAGQLFKE